MWKGGIDNAKILHDALLLGEHGDNNDGVLLRSIVFQSHFLYYISGILT